MMAPWNWKDVTKYYIDNLPPQFQTVYFIMNKDRYRSLKPEHRAILDALAGAEFTKVASASFHDADAKALAEMKRAGNTSYRFVVVSDAERAKMDAEIARGLKTIFASYAARGQTNAQEVYDAINR
jgi:TRAP-type C4-dicarboxylate transport system substrate-binding protein